MSPGSGWIKCEEKSCWAHRYRNDQLILALSGLPNPVASGRRCGAANGSGAHVPFAWMRDELLAMYNGTLYTSICPTLAGNEGSGLSSKTRRDVLGQWPLNIRFVAKTGQIGR